jgi:hypothetical protein
VIDFWQRALIGNALASHQVGLLGVLESALECHEETMPVESHFSLPSGGFFRWALGGCNYSLRDSRPGSNY